MKSSPLNTNKIKKASANSGNEDDGGTIVTSAKTTMDTNINITEDTNENRELTNQVTNDESLHTQVAVTQSLCTLPGAFRVEGPTSAAYTGDSGNSPTTEGDPISNPCPIQAESEQHHQTEIEVDEEIPHVPSAYLVEEEDEEEIAQAEKVKPYFQRKEGQLTIVIVGGLITCLAVLLGVFLSRGDKNDEASTLEGLDEAPPTPAPTFDQRPTLTIVRERGVVNCGIEDFSREGGINLGEYNIDQCRGLAATIFGDPTKINLVIVGADDRYERLMNHEVDVLYAGDTFTLEKLIREPTTGEPLAFGYPYYTDSVVYLGLETYVKCASEQKRFDECEDLSICAVDTPEIQSLITSFFPASFITFGTFPEMERSLKNETGCNVLVSDTYMIYGSNAGLQDNLTNGTYVISDYYISRNLRSSVVRGGDQFDGVWWDIVDASRMSVYRATQIGLSRDESKCPVNSTNDEISFYNAPLCMGNSMEAFKEHLGSLVLSFGPTAFFSSIDAPNFGSLECNDCKDFFLKDGRLKTIKDRGMLYCAVYLDPVHNLTRSSLATLVNIKFCEIMSVAIFQGDSNAVNITYIDEMDYSAFPQEYDVVAGASGEDRVGFNTSNLGTMIMGLPYYTHDKWLYNGTTYDGTGGSISFAIDNADKHLMGVAISVITATVYAQRNGISRSTYFDMPLIGIMGDSLTFMLRDVVMYAGNYDDIINEALTISDGATEIGWNTAVPNYGVAPKTPVFFCDFVASCPPCQWVDDGQGSYVCISFLS